MRTVHRLATTLLVTGMLGSVSLRGAAGDSLPPIPPLTINLRKDAATNAIPRWFSGNVRIMPESDSVEVPLPPLASQDEIGFHALTVVFDDNGDGGPVAEWISPGKERSLLSAGLGETGVAPGLNVRTILIPQGLTLDGGTLRVSFAGRFTRLLTVCVQPCREFGVAAMASGSGFVPGLVIGRDRVLALSEVYGTSSAQPEGDRTEGRTVHAELITAASRLDSPGQLDIIVPMGSLPNGSWIRSEVAGLDPESWIEVSVNGESLGAMGMESFPLQDSGTLSSATGRLIRAGWRRGGLYVPPRLWKEGENSVCLTLRRSSGDEGKPVLVRNASMELLFLPISVRPAAPVPAPVQEPPASPATLLPNSTHDAAATPDSNVLSNGSQYGAPTSLYRTTTPQPLPNDKVTEPSPAGS
jgi:hypothetical protein